MSERFTHANVNLTLRVARGAMRAQGFCVVGLASDSPTHYVIGDSLVEWGGGLLPAEWCLRIIARARRSDWDAQYRLLFPKSDKNPAVERGQRFYRAVLERAAAGGRA